LTTEKRKRGRTEIPEQQNPPSVEKGQVHLSGVHWKNNLQILNGFSYPDPNVQQINLN
jgi:hypothetical protein